ncbi:MAG: sulfide/dihydroorotate dehydrogenase-like FAD/NAD-binding protein [Clostridia bacterium]|nr:sulfide/dihydroorotate dehydrogenase-like FAD/NAD-binding protein [Clostridia bacterium]
MAKRYEIVLKRNLCDRVNEYVIYAPLVAKHCRAGQFVILRTDEAGERVPFTICDYSREAGTVSIMVQEVGLTTMKLASMKEGECLQDFVGPLGNPTDLSEYKNILLVGGGIGSAVIYPQGKQLKKEGKSFEIILGARNKDLFFKLDEFQSFASTHIVTDDGSLGDKGFVTDKIAELFENGRQFDVIFSVGPLGMMKFVAKIAEKYGVKSIVSMNSLMVDGTGMCGCCRLTVDGTIKYACIDGPEFDGSKVDFDEAIQRSTTYKHIEEKHKCNIRG